MGIPFSSGQRNWILFFFACFFLALLCFKSHLFWRIGLAGIWIYNAAVTLSIASLSYSLASLLKMRGIYGVIIFGMAECAVVLAMWLIVQYQPVRIPKLESIKNLYYEFHNVIQYDRMTSVYNRELGYKFKPCIRSSFENWEFGPDSVLTNSAGLRDDESSLKNPVIISLGDSFTAGLGVDQHENFSSQLEKMMGTKVLNAGISSFGTVREVMLFKQLPADSCRLLIIQYCYNDIAENQKWAEALLQGKPFKPSFDQEEYSLRQIQNSANYMYFPFRFIFEMLKKGLNQAFSKPEIQDQVSANRSGEPEIHVINFLKSIRLLRQIYQGNILVISTSNSVNADTKFIETVRADAVRDNLPKIFFLNVSKQFGPADNYRIDGHNTASGHYKIAQQIRDYIRKKQLL